MLQVKRSGSDVRASLQAPETYAAELRVLAAAREHLGMDVAYCGRLTEHELVIRCVDGNGAALGLDAGTTIARADTRCGRLVDGRLPNLIADARHGSQADLAPALGSWVGVAVKFSDGRLYGTLCCASRDPAPWLCARDVEFMYVLGRLLVRELEHREAHSVTERRRSAEIALDALFSGLGARDSYTGGHSEAVVDLATRVARELHMPKSFVDEVRQVALLHDIGKIAMPDAILGKEGPLDDAEWATMRTHPVVAARIVASIDALAHLAPAIRAEHERCDGGGYPDGLTRDQIPLASRITLACDAYHAMTSSRPYRVQPLQPADAAAELLRHAGTQFDPKVVSALLRVTAAANASGAEPGTDEFSAWRSSYG